MRILSDDDLRALRELAADLTTKVEYYGITRPELQDQLAALLKVIAAVNR